MQATNQAVAAYYELLPVNGYAKTGARIELGSNRVVQFSQGCFQTKDEAVITMLEASYMHGKYYRRLDYNPLDVAAKAIAKEKRRTEEVASLRSEVEELRRALKLAGQEKPARRNRGRARARTRAPQEQAHEEQFQLIEEEPSDGV